MRSNLKCINEYIFTPGQLRDDGSCPVKTSLCNVHSPQWRLSNVKGREWETEELIEFLILEHVITSWLVSCPWWSWRDRAPAAVFTFTDLTASGHVSLPHLYTGYQWLFRSGPRLCLTTHTTATSSLCFCFVSLCPKLTYLGKVMTNGPSDTLVKRCKKSLTKLEGEDGWENPSEEP